ncbi:MAG: tRNA (adenosine(37)-N6)-threonylcarbamoyltransferase complex ATPase subunit type 1 TsaE [Thermomonas sp.]
MHLPDETATAELARALERTREGKAVVFLQGELGAGKSTLARAWLRACGVEGAIRSPTYTLVEHYPLARGGNALHLDLYRIGAAGELEFLALDTDDAELWLVEWPERGLAALPAPDMTLALAMEGNGRSALLTPGTPAGAAWQARLLADSGLKAFLAAS